MHLLFSSFICDKLPTREKHYRNRHPFKFLNTLPLYPLFFQALCKKDIVTLKTRLQKIKKHGEEISAAYLSSSSTVSRLDNSAAPAPNNVVPHVPQTAAALTSDAKDLSLTLVRAKELAAKVQARKEECEAEESRQREVQTKDRYGPLCIYLLVCT